MFENIMIFEDLDRGKKINVTKLFPQKMILQTPKKSFIFLHQQRK